MLHKSIFAIALLMLSMTGFEEPQQYTFSIKRSPMEFQGKYHEGILVVIESKQDFHEGAGSWKMIVRDSMHSVEAFRVSTVLALGLMNPDSTSKLIGYFAADAFDVFKNEKVDIVVGYNSPTILVAHNVDQQKDMGAMPKLFAKEFPKLTTAMLGMGSKK